MEKLFCDVEVARRDHRFQLEESYVHAVDRCGYSFLISTPPYLNRVSEGERMIKTTKLFIYEGRLAETTESAGQFVWLSDRETLGEAIEGVMAKLLELKNNPNGVPLRQRFKDDAKPDLTDTKLVEIVSVDVDNVTQTIVVRMRSKEQQRPLGDDETVSEEMVDESIEESFPASDPPALRPTR
jgi:hypothetical protein